MEDVVIQVNNETCYFSLLISNSLFDVMLLFIHN